MGKGLHVSAPVPSTDCDVGRLVAHSVFCVSVDAYSCIFRGKQPPGHHLMINCSLLNVVLLSRSSDLILNRSTTDWDLSDGIDLSQ